MQISEHDQLRLLTHTFITRFFENDLLGSDVDLRKSLAWVVAGLMTPGLMLSVNVLIRYSNVFRLLGLEAVESGSLFEKTMLVGFAMAAMGMVTVVVWDSLLVDRRDCHILGALPVRTRTVLMAKVLALGYFWLITTVAINAVSALLFSIGIGAFVSIPRYLVAHVTSVGLGSAFVFLSVLAVQGGLVGLLGATTYRRASAILQLVFAASLFLAFLLHPYFAWKVTDAAHWEAGRHLGWEGAVPIVWFVGLYEAILGKSWPALEGLGGRALLATFVAAAGGAVAYGAGYRRHIRRTLESHDQPRLAAFGVTQWLAAQASRRCLRSAAARGLAGFVLATVARSTRHRLGIFLALGLGLAVTLIGVPRVLRSAAGLAEPSIELLSIPLVLIFALTCGLKALFKVPSEIAARWVFELSEPADATWLAGARRALVVIGVVPAVAVTTPIFWWLWGGRVAGVHGVVCLSLGLLIVELWMTTVTRVPFATSYLTGNGRIRLLWPLYMQAFFFFAFTTVQIELALANHPVIVLVACAALLAVVMVLRTRHPQRVGRRRLEAFDEQPEAPQQLGLARG
jgi:hypothetical protein